METSRFLSKPLFFSRYLKKCFFFPVWLKIAKKGEKKAAKPVSCQIKEKKRKKEEKSKTKARKKKDGFFTLRRKQKDEKKTKEPFAVGGCEGNEVEKAVEQMYTTRQAAEGTAEGKKRQGGEQTEKRAAEGDEPFLKGGERLTRQ